MESKQEIASELRPTTRGRRYDSVKRNGPSAILFIAVFVLSTLPAFAAQDDERLDELFKRLKTTSDVNEAQNVESTIWVIWTESGRSDVDELMQQGIRKMRVGQLDDALDAFDDIVEIAPGFAEGWNKRATVLYLLDDLPESVRDIHRTLELESRHFGALSGLGLIFIERGDDEAALSAFEEVVKIHPNHMGARIRIERLRAKIRDKLI